MLEGNKAGSRPLCTSDSTPTTHYLGVRTTKWNADPPCKDNGVEAPKNLMAAVNKADDV